MSMNYTDEEYHQMNLEELYYKEIKPNLFAVSRIFAEAHKQMNLAEYKAFSYALSNVKWKDPCPDTLYLDKKEIAKAVGIKSDADHLSVDLNRAIGEMPKHSFLKFSDKESGAYVNGNFVRTIAMFRNVVRIRLEEEFLGLFGNLETNYITMWSEYVFQMKSERAVLFYELLRDNSDTRKTQNTGTVSIRKFKEMFDIPKEGKGSYMRENGGFDRSQFEKRVIDPVCEELTKTRMIQLILQPDGKYYEKVKRGNRVIAYKFYWTLTQHPGVASASEVKAVQERVDADPQLLKVAKDVLKGKSKKNARKATRFHNLEERDDDLDAWALEKMKRELEEEE